MNTYPVGITCTADALRYYGQHKRGCETELNGYSDHARFACTCGFDEALVRSEDKRALRANA